MAGSGPKSLSELLLTPGSALANLAARAEGQGDLVSFVRAGLAEPAAAHLLGCSLDPDNTMVIVADSGPWAARLRFDEERLLDRCREIYPQTQRVRVRVFRSGEKKGGL